MQLEEVIAYFGTQANACKQLNVGRMNFSHWKRRGYIPYRQQVVIERITDGALKADETVVDMLYQGHQDNVKQAMQKRREK